MELPGSAGALSRACQSAFPNVIVPRPSTDTVRYYERAGLVPPVGRIGRLHDHLGQIRGKIDGYASGRTWTPVG